MAFNIAHSGRIANRFEPNFAFFPDFFTGAPFPVGSFQKPSPHRKHLSSPRRIIFRLRGNQLSRESSSRTRCRCVWQFRQRLRPASPIRLILPRPAAAASDDRAVRPDCGMSEPPCPLQRPRETPPHAPQSDTPPEDRRTQPEALSRTAVMV